MRWLKLEPALIGTTAAAVYAAVAMLADVAGHHGILHPDVLLAAGSGLWGLYTRAKVTPLARPRTADGYPLHGPDASNTAPPR